MSSKLENKNILDKTFALCMHGACVSKYIYVDQVLTTKAFSKVIEANISTSYLYNIWMHICIISLGFLLFYYKT